ncbi:hypothetical protein NLI96_g3678 [Meripilus lineatus]|uniref:RGS domain-containing protein n=1 Tax=Meripilus lineatus TaxID=2056292 RepID=A0AAD5V6J9_9APHY|nr:hypothetical protein NLI96_g3678 [Physisporinus lineatus]
MPKSPLSDITLDNILSGETCEPISLADFETYLGYKEYSLENLHFVVWFQDYRKRFFELPQEIQDLSPGTSQFVFSIPCPAKTAQRIADSKKNFAWFFPSRSSHLEDRGAMSPSPYPDTSASFSLSQPSSPMLPSKAPAPVFIPRPEIQPFRDECQAAVATFFKPGASKELSLDSNLRDSIVRDLAWNTHPNVFLPAYEEAYDVLSSVSLPHFLSLASENINLPKKLYWYSIGAVNLLVSLLIAVLIIVFVPGSGKDYQVGPGEWKSDVGSMRAWRLFAVPLSGLGGMQLYSAYKGFCTQVWGRGNTQVRPWELQEPSELTDNDDDDEKTIGMSTTSVSKISPSIAPFRTSNPPPVSPDTLITIAPFASDPSSESSPPRKRLRTPVKRVPAPTTDIPSLNLDGSHNESLVLIPSLTENLSVSPDSFPKRPPRSPKRPPPHPIPTPPQIPTSSNSNSSTSTSTPFSSPDLPSASVQASNKSTDRLHDAPVHDQEPPASSEPKMPVFGPERVVLDPRIRRVHATILRNMIWVGLIWTIVWTAIICSVPGP